MTDLYFAYGSNLNFEDLQNYCRKNNFPFPFEEKISNGYLPDHELIFNYYSETREGGALNIRPETGQVVPGVLFKISKKNWKVLDHKEGAPKRYERKKVTVLTEDGKQIEAVTYSVAKEMEKQSFVNPAPGYTEVVKAGNNKYGIDNSMLDSVSAGKKPKPLINHIFTYGSLMRNEVFHHLLNPSHNIIFIENSMVQGVLYNFGLYPGMILNSKDKKASVSGEIVQIKNIIETIINLDTLENFKGYNEKGSLYRRAILSVETVFENRVSERKNISVPAWVYIINETGNGDIISSGSWKKR